GDAAVRLASRRSGDAGHPRRRSWPRRDAGELSAGLTRIAPGTDRSASRGVTLKRFFRRDRWDDERRLEIESHLAIEIDENVSRGMSLDEARWAAQRKLGNTTRIREEIFRMNTIGVLDAAWRDFRHAARL